MSILAQLHTMSKLRLLANERVVRHRSLKASEESIARAKADCLQARADFTRETGIPITDDGRMQIPELRPLHMAVLEDEGFTVQERSEVAGKVDELVETYGWALVLRSVRSVAAANGQRVMVEDL